MKKQVSVKVGVDVWRTMGATAAKVDSSRQVLLDEAMRLLIEMADRGSFLNYHLYLPEGHWLKNISHK